MKPVAYIILILLGAIFSYNSYRLITQYIGLRHEYAALLQQETSLKQEQVGLADNLSYYSDNDNLVKAFRSQFDYKKEGEKVIKIK